MIASGCDFAHAARRVRAHLDQAHRFAHTLRVARFAERLARIHGADPALAREAGLFHDLARLYSADRLIRECEARELPIDAFARANPIVLHAPLGAELAREMFGVDDPAVLSAIRKHTVGAAVMGPLDVILYLADGLEPGRDYPERAGYATLAERDLTAALQAVLGSTVSYLTARGHAVAPDTLAAAQACAATIPEEPSPARPR